MSCLLNTPILSPATTGPTTWSSPVSTRRRGRDNGDHPLTDPLCSSTTLLQPSRMMRNRCSDGLPANPGPPGPVVPLVRRTTKSTRIIIACHRRHARLPGRRIPHHASSRSDRICPINRRRLRPSPVSAVRPRLSTSPRWMPLCQTTGFDDWHARPCYRNAAAVRTRADGPPPTMDLPERPG